VSRFGLARAVPDFNIMIGRLRWPKRIGFLLAATCGFLLPNPSKPIEQGGSSRSADRSGTVVGPQGVLQVVARMKVSNLVRKVAFCCAATLSGAVVVRVTFWGVSMPEVTTVANKELRLNGMGVRKEEALFQVYVVALYLELPTQDAKAAITTDQEKHTVISMLRR
jgi:hypothetical protein